MDTIDFELKSEFIELFKLLKLTGLCASGGEAKQSIAGGEVTVDGVIETRKSKKIRMGQTVVFGTKKICVASSASQD